MNASLLIVFDVKRIYNWTLTRLHYTVLNEVLFAKKNFFSIECLKKIS
jgi:hypothetical protein